MSDGPEVMLEGAPLFLCKTCGTDHKNGCLGLFSQVNHPSHYGGDSQYECIKVIEAWGLEKDFCLGNTLKYISRAGKKDPNQLLTDLEKASWYLNRKIERLKMEKKSVERSISDRP